MKDNKIQDKEGSMLNRLFETEVIPMYRHIGEKNDKIALIDA